MTAPSPRRLALAELRRARRIRRVGEISWGDAAYRVYVTALGTLFVVYTASGWVGDDELGPSGVDRVLHDGPRWLGLAAALAVLVGARSGRRGGPLAMEAADVHHLLLAPIPARTVLTRPVLRLLGLALLAGAGVGGVVGELVAQRLPVGGGGWLFSTAAFGATTAVLAVGSGLVTAGRRVPWWATVGPAWVLAAWAVADLADAAPTAPTTIVGRIAAWPDRFEAATLVPIALAVPVAFAGWASIGGLSLESARRRTSLIGQIRFAVTQQDLRTVMLLRRQLAAEVPRQRRWFRVPGGSWLADRYPVFVRDLRSLARWPVVRIVRVLVLAVGAALALRGVWSGTTPLVLVAGVAGFVAALDATEPLAQELDHPSRLRSVPVPEGQVLLHHLAAPVVVLWVAAMVGGAVAVGVAPSGRGWALAGVALVPAVAAAVAGAAVSVVAEPTLDASSERLIPPEVAGPRVLIRTVWPPLLATVGLLPVVFGARAERSGDDPLPVLANTAALAVALAAIVFAWVRYRADLHRSMAEAVRGSTG